MRFKLNRTVPVALTFLSLLAVAGPLDEGMWTYNNLPQKYLKDKYGFTVTQAWSDHLMKSSVRFNNGGSGSFISSDGMVLTNHHVAADTLNKISTPTNDLYQKGFYAKSLADEPRSPDLELNQLESIEDVTERVMAAVKPGMDPGQALAAKSEAIAQIEKESFDTTGLRSDVVTLYNGGRFNLYRYKVYTDVRLVFAPEFKAAFFGGDPDNFEYPRYDLDFAIFRVYENGKPAKITHYLKWAPQPVQDNDLVFVSGHPGGTERQLTMSTLDTLRDWVVPYTLDLLKHREVMLQQYSYRGDEQARQAHGMLFGIQNSRKAYEGRLGGLQDPKVMAQKQAAETALRAAVEKSVDLKKYADAWDRVEKAQEAKRYYYVTRQMLEGAQAFNSQLFRIARTLVRMAAEDQKPNDQRLPEYRDSGRPSLEQALFSQAPIYPEFEYALLSDSISYMAAKLRAIGTPHEQLVDMILNGKSPAELAYGLVYGTKLGSVDERRKLAQGGLTAIRASSDPMIAFAELVDDYSRAIRKAYEEEVLGVEQAAYSDIAQATFAVQGTGSYPDATFTLRLSFGTVTGYMQDGKYVDPITTIGGAFDHEAAHGGRDPWQLPDSWHQAKSKLNLALPFNFASSADIIGGNSGSPVVNRDGELVGLIFDGNIQSLVGDYIFDESQNRAVSVTSQAIVEALRNVYGAGDLADKLGK